MAKRKPTKPLFRGKEHGIKILRATIAQMATPDGPKLDAKSLSERILYVREKLKREMLMSKISVMGVSEAEQIDEIPASRELTVCLNPYYELAIVKNLKPFPVLLDSPAALKWLSHFDTYLAMNLLYFRDNNAPLPDPKQFNYTNAELLETRELLSEYYDLENPRTNLLEANPNVSYYHPFPNLIELAEADVLDYEKACALKSPQ